MLKKLLIGVAFAALFFACSGPNGPMSEDSQTTDTAAESSIEERFKADYTKHEFRIPIQPGESASITCTYNAKVSGKFRKSIVVNTNVNYGEAVLYISGEVK